MSYLDFPRLHFAGRFQADPSTVNNYAPNFDIETPRPADNGTDFSAPHRNWNPNGTAAWHFVDCRITGVVDGAGRQQADDQLLGRPLSDATARVPGKIVDLDPQQQSASQLWGVRLQLGQDDSKAELTADYVVSPFWNMWLRSQSQRAAVNGQTDPLSQNGAAWQSALENLCWADDLDSAVLTQLRDQSPHRLSIQFAVDGYCSDPQSALFTYGRIVGTIGPVTAAEPTRFVNGRMLRRLPTTKWGYGNTASGNPFYFAPFQFSRERSLVSIDLSNSVPTTEPAGAMSRQWLTDGSSIQLLALPANGAPVQLGAVNYATAGWYTTQGGLIDVPIAAEHGQLVAEQPLALGQYQDGNLLGLLLQENGSGLFVRADEFVYRLNPGQSADVDFWVTRFGQPAAGEVVELRRSTSPAILPQWPGSPPIGTPAEGVEFTATTAPTDAQGRVTVQLRGHDPGNPRRVLDGQIYGIQYAVQSESWSDYFAVPSAFLSVCVYDQVTVIERPTWDDVAPILTQYWKLFPLMDRIVDLSNQQDVTAHVGLLRMVFNLDLADPNFMPVSRDLSVGQLQLLNNYFDQVIAGSRAAAAAAADTEPDL